jgi:hypothetical protein
MGVPAGATSAERRSLRRDGQRLMVGLRVAKLRHGMTESENGCLPGGPVLQHARACGRALAILASQ